MSTIDLALPECVPDMARYQNRPMTLDAFAIYNLIDGEKELLDLIEECQSQCPRDDYVYLRKAPGITSLESLIDFHLDTTVPDGFDPNLFLVVTDVDWQRKGLMIVTLDDDEGRPDKFTLKAVDSGILLINLQIGNTDWYEAKENYELTSGDATLNTQTEGTFPDGASIKKPATGFYIAIYSIPNINPTDLIRAIEPFHNQKAPEDRICRFEGFLKLDRDLVYQTMDSWHTQACMSNRYLCKMYFLIADSVEYEEKGLLMCGVKEKKSKRIVVSQGVTVSEFCKIAQGRKGWDEA